MTKSARFWIGFVVVILVLDVAIAMVMLYVSAKNPVQPPAPQPSGQPQGTTP